MVIKRDKSIQRRARAKFRAQQPNCHICGEAIDWDAPHTDPRAFVVDHVKPLALGGEDALPNMRAAHSPCVQQRKACATIRTNHQAIRSSRAPTRGLRLMPKKDLRGLDIPLPVSRNDRPL